MSAPSSNWTGFTGLDVNSDRYPRIKSILSTANFDYLRSRAIAARKAYQPDTAQDINCSLNLTAFTTGFNNLVLEVEFSDHVYWIARVLHQTFDEDVKTSMLSEISTMKLVKKHTNIPIPHVFDFEATINQPFGFPFMLIEYLGGRTLPDGLARAIPKEHHPKVARHLAKVFNQLQNLTFSRIGRLWCGDDTEQPVEIIPMEWHATPGPLRTSLEYFHNQRQSESQEAMELQPGNTDRMTACWVLKSTLSHMIVDDRIYGPFPLCHLDFHFGNMLFDDEYNLVGVIDWSNAQSAPLEQLSVFPEFATAPGLSEEQNRPMIELKELVVKALQELEREKPGEQHDLALPLDDNTSTAAATGHKTQLSEYMASKMSEIAFRQYMSNPRSYLWDGKTIAKLVYGSSITWDQLKDVYGIMSQI